MTGNVVQGLAKLLHFIAYQLSVAADGRHIDHLVQGVGVGVARRWRACQGDGREKEREAINISS